MKKNTSPAPDSLLATIPTADEIRARAYALYVARGRQPGHELDDWLQAEYELLRLPVRKLADLGPAEVRPESYRKLAVASLVQTALLLGSGVPLAARLS